MDAAQLRVELNSADFVNVREVSPEVLVAERRWNEAVFSRCYFCLGDAVPQTPDALEQLQNSLIAPEYFTGPKHLQWNTYLYLVVSRLRLSQEGAEEWRSLVERERRYCRKQIVTDSQLHEMLMRRARPRARDEAPNAIVETWMRRLETSALLPAVEGDMTLPQRVEAALRPRARSRARPLADPGAPRQGMLAQLEHLQVERYRDRGPLPPVKFGMVTLVTGPNGSGKTSLLEAIELLYCGKNRRNPTATRPFRISAKFSNGEEWTTTDAEPLSTFRERNLEWFGQAEIRTSKLYQSFARFNFLDTDAAVRLMDQDDDYEDTLAKLVVGPAASEMWDTITRLHKELGRQHESSIRDVRQRCQHERSLREVARSALGEPSAAKDLEASLLRELVVRGWDSSIESPAALATRCQSDMTALITLLDGLGLLALDAVPATMQEIQSLQARLAAQRHAGEGFLNSIREARAAAVETRERLDSVSHALDLASALDALLASGVVELGEEEAKLQEQVTRGHRAIGSLGPSDLTRLPAELRGYGLARLKDTIQQDLQRIEGEVADWEARISGLESKNMKLELLASQLRDLGIQLIELRSNASECPLCGAGFEDGGLAVAIASNASGGEGDGLDAARVGLRASQEIREQRKAALAVVHALGHLAEVLEMPPDTPSGDCFDAAEKLRASIETAEVQLAQVRQKLADLKQAGHDASTLRSLRHELTSALSGSGFEQVDAPRDRGAALAVEREALSERYELLSRKERELTLAARDLLQSPGADLEALQEALASVQQRQALSEEVAARLEGLAKLYPWDSTTPLAGLLVDARMIRALAAQLAEALAQASAARRAKQDTDMKLRALRLQLRGALGQLRRLRTAYSALDGLMQEASLTDATHEALRQNRELVGHIFAALHSPREFSGLGENLLTVIRAADQSEASLSEISTGQRAAYALALFLAENARLVSAPPLILLDDPIGHVDDLNSLSFMDYLRDVIVGGGRQLVFATANSKIAALFRRKFEFLGEEQFAEVPLHPNGMQQ